MKKRDAIAMLELIFAIVVMGIAMLAIPMITSQSFKGSEAALMQESVAAAASQIEAIGAKPWDNANALQDTVSILTTQSGSFDTRSGLVEGTGLVVGNSRNLTSTVATAVNTDINNTDIGDFNGSTAALTVYNSQNSRIVDGDYVDQNISIGSTVNYTPDDAIVLGANTVFNYNPAANSAITTSIKSIAVTLTSTNVALPKTIILRSFSCNIGVADPLTRSN